MSIAGSINSLSDVNVSYIGSAEDAIALSSAVQLGVSDELSKFLKVEIEAKNGFSDVIKNYSGIKSQLSSLLSQTITKVTPDSIRNAGTSSAALTKLFNADGIRLGSNFDESNAALQSLQEQGVNLSTTVEYPGLQQNFDSKGNPLSESFGWIIPKINGFIGSVLSSAPSDKYENATVYYFGEPGKSTQLTVFNDQKNIRVDPQSINDSLVQAKDKYDSFVEALNNSIAKINTATSKLNDAIEDISKVSATQQKMIADLRNARENSLNQNLDTRRIDRINFLNKLDQKNRFENEANSIDSINDISIIDRNKSNKVENLSPISDWKSTETKSSRSLENQIFQARDNLNTEQPQNKTIPYLDIGKII
jgi:hypothetical protein